MSASIRRNILCFIKFIVLFFTSQIQFVRMETNVGGIDDNAMLIQESFSSAKVTQDMYSGKEVRVLAYNYPPIFFYKTLDDGNYTFGGLFKNTIEEIAAYTNMSLKYVVLNSTEVTKYGLWKAVYNSLDRKEIDIAPYAFIQSLEAAKHMELITPISIQPLMILQPYPEEESRLDVTTRPFQLPVWLCYLGTATVFVIVSAIIIKNRMDIDDLNPSRQSLRLTIYNQVDYVVRLFTNQGSSGTHARTRTSFKILTGIWLLSMVVLINAYSGVLTSLLTVPKLKPIVKTMKELAESKELRVTTVKNVFLEAILLNATEGYEKILGDQLRKDPSLLVSDGIAATENVIRYKAAYPQVADFVKYMLGADTQKNGKCRMALSPELTTYTIQTLQWGVPKGNPFAAFFNEIELRRWDNGMMERTHRPFNTIDRCRTDKPPETKMRALTSIDFSPAFLILGAGLILSTFCFVMEVLSKRVLIRFQERVGQSNDCNNDVKASIN